MTFAELLNKVGFQVDEKSVSDVNRTINNISGFARRALGVIGIGISLTQLNAIAEEFDAIGDRMAYAAGEGADLEAINKKILSSANACRTGMTVFANQVTKLKQANAKLFPIEDAAEMVEYTNKLGKAAGYSDGEISNMNNTVMRLISRDKVMEGEIVQMIRQTPALAEILAKSLGKDTDQLQAMAKAGQITAETVKKAVLGSKDEIDSAFSNLNYGIGDMLVQVRNRFGVFVDETNKQFNITQSIAKFLYSMFDRLMAGLTRLRNGVQWLSDKVGGINNLMKLLAIVAGAVFTALNISKVTSFLKMVSTFLDAGKLKILAIIAVLVLIALIVEDFIGFMQGKDSLIGKILEQAGIDADAFRQKILDVFGKVRQFFADHSEQIKAIFSDLWGIVKNIFQTAFYVIALIARVVFEGLRKFWDKWGGTIVATFKNVFDTVIGVVQFFMAAFRAWGDFIVAILSGDVAGAVSALKSLFSNVFQGIVTLASGIIEQIKIIVGAIIERFAGLPGKALRWGKDLVQNLIDGILSLKDKVGEAVSGVATKIRRFLGFSEPEEGPLSDFHTYMPDMIDLMAQGISSGRTKIAEAIAALSDDMSVDIKGASLALAANASPKASTVNSVATNNNVSKSVVQNNSFTNTFNGDRAIQRQAASAMKQSSADVTGELARAMAYTG